MSESRKKILWLLHQNQYLDAVSKHGKKSLILGYIKGKKTGLRLHFEIKNPIMAHKKVYDPRD